MISGDLVTINGMPTELYYNLQQLLQAENEYNKAALQPNTLDEYNQVLNRNPPEKPAEPLLRANENTWTDSRIG